MYSLPLKSREIEPFVWWTGLFSDEELDKLQEAAKNAKDPGVIGSDLSLNKGIRRSNIMWLEVEEWGWAFQKLGDLVTHVNDTYYRFELTGFGEKIQLSNYKSEDGGTYIWHQDFGGQGLPRKLSVVLQLSEPHEYEGGNLELFTGGSPSVMQKERGRITIFPSWTLHQVTPVTKGERQSLVTWIYGPNFK